MSELKLVKIIFLVLLFSVNNHGQSPKSTDSLTILSKEVKSIISEKVRNPLQAVETISPQATLRSFIENIYKAYRIIMLANKENQLTPGLSTPDSIKLKAQDAFDFFQRGIRCLNTSDIPESLRKNFVERQTLKLKEILDRIDLPPLKIIPNVNELEVQNEDSTITKHLKWRIPHTEIVIARTDNGPRKGEYLFTSETVEKLDEYYNKVKDLPYKSDSFITPGFYNFYISTPGKFLPPKWMLWLPEWSNTFFLEQTIWQWIFFITYIIISCLILVLFYHWFYPWDLTLKPVRRNLRKIYFILLLLIIMIGLDSLDREHINMTGIAKILVTIPLSTIFWLLVSVLVLMIFKLMAEIIIASPRINPLDIQASYIRAVFSVIGFLLAIIIFIYGLSRIGVSLVPLLAGVGIGGLAIALAVRPTLENLVGSFLIFTDKPFKVGQRIMVTGYNGIVEKIGLRSTKIRLLNGSLTSVPNEKMVRMVIENIGQRPYIRRTFNIGINYNTSPEKIIRAVKILTEILSVPAKSDKEIFENRDLKSMNDSENNANEKTHPNEAINKPGFPPRIYFNDFNADSLNIYVSYWYHPPEWWEYNEHVHWINLQIKERFNVEGIEFAFPTQTIHLTEEKNNQLPLTDKDKQNEKPDQLNKIE